MPTFTPPTYEYSAVEATPRQHPGWPLFRHYDWPRGYTVLITNGVATPHPGTIGPSQDDIDAADPGSGAGNRAAFLGGRTYTITAAEQAILETAGYTVEE